MKTTKDGFDIKLEQKQCPICGVIHSNNAGVLISTRAGEKINNTVTGFELCEADEKLMEAGYIACVCVNNIESNDRMKMEDAERNGEICHVKRTVFEELFNTTISDTPIVFVEKQVIEYLKSLEVRH